MARAFGPILGARRLIVAGSRRPVTVTLGKPRRSERYAETWECPFGITGLGNRGSHYGYGVDAIQALTNALEGIRVTLERSGKRLGWFEPGDAAGFERVIPSVFGRRFTQRLHRIIDREIALNVRALERRWRRRQARRRRRSR